MPLRQHILHKILSVSALMITDLMSWSQSDSLQSSPMIGNIYNLLLEDTVLTSSPQQSSVAGYINEDIRETPGAILILSADQIKATGATDIMDVLMTVPGIGLGRDVDDVIGVGMRGLWAHEGKVMFMFNGIPLNELDFGSYALGNRMPIENISRIEIYNGPGSVVYGGAAALGVINIVTKTPLEMSGTRITAESAVSNGLSSSNLINVTSNHHLGGETYVATQVSIKSALRSTRDQSLSDGNLISFGDSTRIQSQNIFIGVSKKNFKTQFYLNNYIYDVSDEPYGIMMLSMAWDNNWHTRISKKTTMTLRSIYQYQMPWFNLNSSDPDLISTNTITQRITGSVIFNHQFNSKLKLSGGVQGFEQYGRVFAKELTYSINDNNRIRISDFALHGELSRHGKIGIFRLGGRVEKNTFSEILYSPRFAYNKILGKYYFKVLLSDAFKVPTVQNINLGPEENLRHESVASGEFTIGKNLGSHSSAEIAGYRTSIFNPIVYATDTIQVDNYLNRAVAGTEGIEGRILVQSKKISLHAGFCLYRVIGNSDIAEYEIAENKFKAYLGLPSTRASFSSFYRLNQIVGVNFSWLYQGKNFSYEYDFLNPEEKVLFSQPETFIMNLGVQIIPDRMKSLRIITGINNVFDSPFFVASPMTNGPVSMPLYARQLTLNIQYRFNT